MAKRTWKDQGETVLCLHLRGWQIFVQKLISVYSRSSWSGLAEDNLFIQLLTTLLCPSFMVLLCEPPESLEKNKHRSYQN